jgi:hypothetical protein
MRNCARLSGTSDRSIEFALEFCERLALLRDGQRAPCYGFKSADDGHPNYVLSVARKQEVR